MNKNSYKRKTFSVFPGKYSVLKSAFKVTKLQNTNDDLMKNVIPFNTPCSKIDENYISSAWPSAKKVSCIESIIYLWNVMHYIVV